MSEQTARTPDDEHKRTLEALSSLVDGELDAAHCTGLLQKVCADPHVRRHWTLLHVMGDALRSSEVASLHSEAFVARVAGALEAEPAIVAPRAMRSGPGRFVRRVALPGIAMAAAAAVVVFVAVPQLRDPAATSVARLPAPASSPAPVLSAPAPSTVPVAGDATPAGPGSAPAGGAVIEPLPEFDAYLAAHREQSGTQVMLRSAPYLRTSATVPR